MTSNMLNCCHLIELLIAKIKKLIRSETGISAVEFAIIAPILLIIISGIINIGLVLNAKFNLENQIYTASNYALFSGLSTFNDIENLRQDVSDIVEAGKWNKSIIIINPDDIIIRFEDEEQIPCVGSEPNLDLVPDPDQETECGDGPLFMQLTVPASINNLLFDAFSSSAILANSYVRLR